MVVGEVTPARGPNGYWRVRATLRVRSPGSGRPRQIMAVAPARCCSMWTMTDTPSAPATPPPGPDWGVGRYETTAERLLPVAREVVRRAAIGAGERVLDLGCGTGNAALLAAEHTADVVGVDPAERLLEVARKRAAELGSGASFRAGSAAAIPCAQASADVLLSVFAVIFAPDPSAAAAEMARVLAPGGRVLLSAWPPDGALQEVNGTLAGTVRAALGAPPAPPPFGWHDGDALAALFAPHGLRVELAERAVEFTAPSVEAYLDEQASTHPMAVSGFAVLARHGRAEELRGRVRDILEAANEAPGAFRLTCPYVVATVRADG
jgi:SAM-dependent methyltransferase